MSKAQRVPAGYVYLVMTLHFWGKGRTRAAALQRVQLAGGKQQLKKYGYLLFRVHPDTEVDELGSMVSPRGKKPVKVGDHLK